MAGETGTEPTTLLDEQLLEEVMRLLLEEVPRDAWPAQAGEALAGAVTLGADDPEEDRRAVHLRRHLFLDLPGIPESQAARDTVAAGLLRTELPRKIRPGGGLYLLDSNDLVESQEPRPEAASPGRDPASPSRPSDFIVQKYLTPDDQSLIIDVLAARIGHLEERPWHWPREDVERVLRLLEAPGNRISVETPSSGQDPAVERAEEVGCG